MPLLEQAPTTRKQAASVESFASGPLANVRPSRAVVVHSGARDGYQLALALEEAGLLECLVTDLFWSQDSRIAKTFSRDLPKKALAALLRRSVPGLPGRRLLPCSKTGLCGLLLEKLPHIPVGVRRSFMRYADGVLGRTAGRRARKKGAALVSYSYYGYDAFKAYGAGGMLFQVHPHPATMRRILLEELKLHPECADSLKLEWELALPEQDFQHLVQETEMASRYLVASSFSRDSLVEHGASKKSINVIPYGIDLDRFHPDPAKSRSRSSKLRLLFVGRINQRKGVKYLLDALRLLDTDSVELTVCGRVVDGLDLFRPFASRVEIRPSVSDADLVAAYQSADLFVFPSLGEGFGHVLLEAMACGLPFLSTTHTAAPDLIDDGVQGFIVQPRRPDLLAARIEWAIRHRGQLEEMGTLSRDRAQHFTWQRFRRAAAEEVRSFMLGEALHGKDRGLKDV
ncbi:glycosyltransferase involved in cell wall biosynthesis [Silvibacterium bohemicum]|uniref:Glycosyltransferase involved in cell wall biosynthesis n=1 Tax=Silvibacterium bohemicum TaxID=1577686 RepID=A0A841JQR8_9BACT|nr:glycosyltransferase family 4 protein [Silvibacterium bohemicum]MBB6143676.1 glycosyltransferase involved in cell wall biosynthesis [Silvibacterium bohemicum]